MIIGVSGKKRSGKDTFYEIIKNELKNKQTVKRYAFADRVKICAKKYFGINQSDIKLEQNRFILQGIGQMLRQEINPNYWINIVIREMMESRSKNPDEISVITDLRYINEVEEILSLGNSVVVRIERNQDNYDNHISETDLNNYPFDFYIKNNEDVDSYRREVLSWIKLNLPWIIHW
jgi:hypothetical protein